MVTIIFVHPWHGSFNKAILDTITKKYDSDNKAYQVIDLYADKFDPVFHGEELALYSKGQYKDALVGKYQSMLNNSSELVVLFPVWWMNMPAMLKGFFDKVMLFGFAYNYENGWSGLLHNIKKSTVITTSEQDTSAFPNVGDPINAIIRNSLLSVGITDTSWLNCDHVSLGSEEHRKDFLKIVEKHV